MRARGDRRALIETTGAQDGEATSVLIGLELCDFDRMLLDGDKVDGRSRSQPT